jgi:selenocysteine lyase/cysteine desulfurase
VINAYVARAGMGIINELGPAKIRSWLEILSRRLIEGGRARGLTLHGTNDVARKTPSTAFIVDDSHRIEAVMRARGVLPSARGSVIRLARISTTRSRTSTARSICSPRSARTT